MSGWRSSPRRAVIPIAAAAWLLMATAGIATLWEYENAPGPGAQAPERWPHETGLTTPREVARLVVVAHPKCPCTRATMRELERLMAENDGRVDADVLFVTPTDAGHEYHRTDLFDLARRIPNVRVHRDDDARESRRFGAATSGQTLLYDAEGTLLFSGGITAGRGHEGDNAGRSAVYALLREAGGARSEANVFGCALHDPSAASESGRTAS